LIYVRYNELNSLDTKAAHGAHILINFKHDKMATSGPFYPP